MLNISQTIYRISKLTVYRETLIHQVVCKSGVASAACHHRKKICKPAWWGCFAVRSVQSPGRRI